MEKFGFLKDKSLITIWKFVNQFQDIEDVDEDDPILLDIYKAIQGFIGTNRNLQFLAKELYKCEDFSSLYTLSCKIVTLTSQLNEQTSDSEYDNNQ